MPRPSILHPLLAATLGLSLLAGCQPPAAAPAGSSGPDAGAVTPNANPNQPIGLFGRAELNGVPFGDAQVQVFKPGETTPIATGTTDANGKFTFLSGNVIAAGGGNVIAAGGGNVIAAGGGNVIAAGGGNVIAAGGGNVIASGGLNLISPGAPLKVVASKGGQALASVGVAGVIAAGGGNVIAAGGGNIIASGGLNYRTQQAPSNEVLLTLSTTLATQLLGDRLDGVGRALMRPDGTINDSLIGQYLNAFNTLNQACQQLIASVTDQSKLAAFITHPGSLDLGQLTGMVSPEAIQSLLNSAATVAEEMAEVIRQGVQQGGLPPTEQQSKGMSFGDRAVPPVNTRPANTNGDWASGISSGGGSSQGPSVSLGGTFTVPSEVTPISAIGEGVFHWDNNLNVPRGSVPSSNVTLAPGEHIDLIAPTGVTFAAALYDLVDLQGGIVWDAGSVGANVVDLLSLQFLDKNGQPLGSGPYMVPAISLDDGVGIISVSCGVSAIAAGADLTKARGLRISSVSASSIHLDFSSVEFGIWND